MLRNGASDPYCLRNKYGGLVVARALLTIVGLQGTTPALQVGQIDD